MVGVSSEEIESPFTPVSLPRSSPCKLSIGARVSTSTVRVAVSLRLPTASTADTLMVALP